MKSSDQQAKCKLSSGWVPCQIVKENALTFLVRLPDGNIIKRRRAWVVS